MTLLDSAPTGVQEPTFLSLPPSVSSAGLEAVELAASVGLQLDPWQQLVLDGALGERADGKWSAFEVGLVMPRQNGKGSILEARELAGLFLFGEQLILHSAHEFKTAAEAFRRVLNLVEGSNDLSRRVKKVRTSHGEEGIELLTGQRLRFVARSGGSGRGFSGDLVILDEAFKLLSEAVAALLPTMSARPNPQLWYTSSAPLVLSLVLKKLCRRGRAGRSPGLAYFEWCSRIAKAKTREERHLLVAEALDDRAAWAQANPALGIRISPEFIGHEREAMEPETFGRERLGIYDDEEDGEGLIPRETWDLVCSPDVKPEGDLLFSLAVNPQRSAAAIVAVADKTIEVIDHHPGVGWVIDRAVELDDRWSSPPLVVDGRSSAPVAALVPDLQAAGLNVVSIPGKDIPAACGRFYDDIVECRARVRRHASLDAAIAGAVKADLGAGAFTWDCRHADADISPLEAATLGLWAAAEGYSDPLVMVIGGST